MRSLESRSANKNELFAKFFAMTSEKFSRKCNRYVRSLLMLFVLVDKSNEDL